MPLRHEEALQLQICGWMRIQHPGIMFTCDLGSGMKMTMWQATKAQHMRSQRGMPDMMILEPRGVYHGLFLELKKKGTRVFKADGSIVADAHIQEQASVLAKLNLKGYLALFAVGFEDATEKINKYLTPIPAFPHKWKEEQPAPSGDYGNKRVAHYHDKNAKDLL